MNGIVNFFLKKSSYRVHDTVGVLPSKKKAIERAKTDSSEQKN